MDDASRIREDISGWDGFIFLIGVMPYRLTIIGYYPVINNPIAEDKTVQECPKQAEDVTHEVRELYVDLEFV